MNNKLLIAAGVLVFTALLFSGGGAKDEVDLSGNTGTGAPSGQTPPPPAAGLNTTVLLKRNSTYKNEVKELQRQINIFLDKDKNSFFPNPVYRFMKPLVLDGNFGDFTENYVDMLFGKKSVTLQEAIQQVNNY